MIVIDVLFIFFLLFINQQCQSWWCSQGISKSSTGWRVSLHSWNWSLIDDIHWWSITEKSSYDSRDAFSEFKSKGNTQRIPLLIDEILTCVCFSFVICVGCEKTRYKSKKKTTTTTNQIRFYLSNVLRKRLVNWNRQNFTQPPEGEYALKEIFQIANHSSNFFFHFKNQVGIEKETKFYDINLRTCRFHYRFVD